MDARKRKKQAARYMANLDTIKRLTDQITEPLLVDLLRRQEVSPESDGYPAGGSGDGSKSADETTSTERAALRGLPEDPNARDDWRRHVTPDPIGQAIEAALGNLVEMAGLAKEAHRKIGVVIHAADGRRGRQSLIGQCLACGADVSGVGTDRIKAGYGNRCCYSAWTRFARRCDDEGVDASHVVFRYERRAQLAERAAEAAATS